MTALVSLLFIAMIAIDCKTLKFSQQLSPLQCMYVEYSMVLFTGKYSNYV